jgi:superfamily II DNA or RNA helicase
VIADECHHLTAFSFEQVMRQVKAKFIVGLTATPTRKDGHHPIIFMQCGLIQFNLSAREAAERSPFRHLVLPRQTGFPMPTEATDLRIHDAYAALVTNEERNQQIVADVLSVVREGRTPLVLTNRTDHLERLASGLSEIQHVFILKGGMRKKEREAALQNLAAIPDGTPRVLLATGSYIGEGSTTRDWTLCFSPCQSHGVVRCSNTSGGCIGFITERESSECSITSMRRFRCLAACSRSG